MSAKSCFTLARIRRFRDANNGLGKFHDVNCGCMIRAFHIIRRYSHSFSSPLMTFVNRRAALEKLNGKVAHCVVPILTKTLNSNTQHIRELERLYKESVGQCSQ